DGYKAFFVKSNAVVPGIIGGQFDAEFRGRNPSEKAQLLDKMKDSLAVFEGTWVNNLMIVFNTTRKPFDDIRVRQALSMAIDQWRRVGVVAEHEQLETKLYQDRVAAGDFDVAIEFQADFMDDPTAQFSKFLTKKASPSGYSGHTDTKIDDMYEKQRRTIDVAERTKIVREMERYSLVQAYNVPLLWWQRIIVNNKKIHGWYMTPSHYLWQDLSTVWLD